MRRLFYLLSTFIVAAGLAGCGTVQDAATVPGPAGAALPQTVVARVYLGAPSVPGGVNIKLEDLTGNLIAQGRTSGGG